MANRDLAQDLMQSLEQMVNRDTKPHPVLFTHELLRASHFTKSELPPLMTTNVTILVFSNTQMSQMAWTIGIRSHNTSQSRPRVSWRMEVEVTAFLLVSSRTRASGLTNIAPRISTTFHSHLIVEVITVGGLVEEEAVADLITSGM
jgi:hypothetical protein